MVPTPMHVDMFLSVCYQASCHAHGITWFMLKNKAFYCIINNIKCIVWNSGDIFWSLLRYLLLGMFLKRHHTITSFKKSSV